MPTKSIADLRFLKRLNDDSDVFLYEYENLLYVNLSDSNNRTNFRDAILVTAVDVFTTTLIDVLEKNNLAEEVFNQLDNQYIVEYLLWKMKI